MIIDLKLSPASDVDAACKSPEFNYIDVFGGYALILAIVVSLATYGCCRLKNSSKKTAVTTSSENAPNVSGAQSNSYVVNATVSVNTNTGQTSSADISSVAQSRPRVSDDDSRHRSRFANSGPTVSVMPSYYQTSSAIKYPATKGAVKHSRMDAIRTPRGLINNGNTCFFNSVIQALGQTPILEKQLAKIGELGAAIGEFTWIYTSMNNGDMSALDPQRLQRLMYKRTGRFKIGKQHDSHECLLNILHELRKDERQGRAEPLTVVDKIFGGHCMTVYKCRACGTPSHLCEPFLDISLPICSSPRESRKHSARSSRSDLQYATGRPLPALDNANQVNSRQHEGMVARMTIQQDTADEDRRDRGPKRKERSESGSRERGNEQKFQRRSQDVSKSTASRITEQTASNKQDQALAYKESYRRAVSSMMTTLSKGRDSNGLCTLENSFRSYTRREDIIDEYLCRDCNLETENEDQIRLTSATKQTLIYNPPAVLTIHLKRFENTSRGYVKRTTMVDYKEVLDLAPYCSSWLNDPPPTQNVWYSLYAVVVHQGTLQCGHYFAYVKVREYNQKILQFLQKRFLNRDDITADRLIQMMNYLQPEGNRPYSECPDNTEGTWYCMNDHAVQRVSAQEALGQEAFLLFYERL